MVACVPELLQRQEAALGLGLQASSFRLGGNNLLQLGMLSLSRSVEHLGRFWIGTLRFRSLLDGNQQPGNLGSSHCRRRLATKL